MADYVKTLIDGSASNLENEVSAKFDQINQNMRDILLPREGKGKNTEQDLKYYQGIETITSKKEASKNIDTHFEADMKHLQKQMDAGKINKADYDQAVNALRKKKDAAFQAIDGLIESTNGAQATRAKQYKAKQAELNQVQSEFATGIESRTMTLKKAMATVSSLDNIGRTVYGDKKAAPPRSKTPRRAAKKISSKPKNKTIELGSNFSLSDVSKAMGGKDPVLDEIFNIGSELASSLTNNLAATPEYGLSEQDIAALDEASRVWSDKDLTYKQKKAVDDNAAKIRQKQKDQVLKNLGGAKKLVIDNLVKSRKAKGLDTDETFLQQYMSEIEATAASVQKFQAPVTDKASAYKFVRAAIAKKNKYAADTGADPNTAMDIAQIIRDNGLEQYFGMEKQVGTTTRTKPVDPRIVADIMSDRSIAGGSINASKIASPNSSFLPHINKATASKLVSGTGSEYTVRSIQDDINEQELIERVALQSLKATPYKKGEKKGIITDDMMSEIYQMIDENDQFAYSKNMYDSEEKAKAAFKQEVVKKVLQARQKIQGERFENALSQNSKPQGPISTSGGTARYTSQRPIKRLDGSKGMLAHQKSNQRIVDNYNAMGRGVDVAPLMGKTVAQHQQDTIKAFAEQGIETSFDGDNVTFRYGDQAPITVKMAELTGGNTISRGGQKYHNRGMAVTEYDERGKGKAIMSDAYGQQYAGLSNLATRYVKDQEGNVTTEPGKIVEAIKTGAAGSVNAIVGNVINAAIGKVGANVPESVAKEVNKDYEANKTAEQAYVQRGTYTLNPMFEQAIRNKNNIGLFQGELDRNKRNTTDLSNYYHDIPTNFLEAFNTIADLLGRGEDFADAAIQGMDDDNIAKRIWNGRMQDGKWMVKSKDAEGNEVEHATNLNYTLDSIRKLAHAGLISRMDSIKEESVMAGNRTVASANDFNPFGAFSASHSRASHQVNNYMERVNAPKLGVQGMWGSRAARMNGVDENSWERTQYTGTMMNDAELNDLIQKVNAAVPGLISEEMSQILSTEDGGMIVSESMAKELQAYLPQKKAADEGDINASFLTEKLGLTLDQISKMQKGEIISLDQVMDAEANFSKDVKLNKGDVLQGIEKTENGMRLHYKQVQNASTGSKALLGYTGGRQTIRKTSDNVMAALNAAKFGKGVEDIKKAAESGTFEGGAQFITEHVHDSSRKNQFDITGRMNEIVANAAKQGLTTEEILEGFKGTQYEKAMRLNENGQIESSLRFDEGSQRFRYTDEQGVDRDFFDYDENNIANEGQLARATIENVGSLAGQIEGISETTLSDFQMLENNLGALATEKAKALGDENFVYQKSNQELFKDYVNMAKQYPYEETMGSGNAYTVEAEGRVQYGNKERDANRAAIAEAKLRHKGDEEAVRQLEALAAAEEKSTNKVGKDRAKAIQDQAKVQQALKASFEVDDYGNFKDGARFSFSGQQNAELGVADKEHSLIVGTNDKGEITFTANGQTTAMPGLKTDLDFDEEGNTGYTEEEYNKSLVAVAKQFMQANGLSQMVVQNGSESMLMPLLDDTTLGSGNKLLARTSGALHGMFKQQEDGTVKMVDNFREVKNNLQKYAYHKDSKLVQRAEKSNISNSSWTETVGGNTGNKEKIRMEANSVYVTTDKLKELMTTANGASQAEVLKNAQQLTMMRGAAGGNYEETQKSVQEQLDGLAKMSVEELRTIESELINEIIGMAKSGDIDLTSQFHRFPSTSGNDIRYSSLKINDAIGNKSGMLINRGNARTVNGDYDGDHTPIRLMGLDFADNYREYFDATKGADLVKANHTEVARKMEDDEKSGDYGGHNVDKQVKMVKEMSNGAIDQFAGIASKTNKKYVGMFSNQSAAFRNYAKAFDLDEVGAAKGNSELSDKEIAQIGIMRSFLETFEQEAISAKKIGERMNGIGDIALDELNPMYKMLGNLAQGKGTVKDVINAAMQSGILSVNKETGDIDMGRQWRFNKYTAESAGIDFNKEFAGMSNFDILASSIQHFVDNIGEHGLEAKHMTSMSAKNLVKSKGEIYKSKQKISTQTKQSNARAKAAQSRKSGGTTVTITAAVKQAETVAADAKATAEEAKAEADVAKEEADQAMIDEEGGGPRTTGKYRAMKATNAADYETSHIRELREWDGSGSTLKSGGGYGATASQIDDIAGYANRKANSQQYWGKPEQIDTHVQASSALGTYGHKVAEILNKHQAKFLKDLDGVLTEEEKKELAYAEKVALGQYGLVSEQDLIEYAQGAEQLVNAGRQAAPELFGANAITEHAMGGVFVRDDGTEHTFSGEADVMARKDDGSGYSIGDYKFSKKSGSDTIAKRIMQQSIYLAMREQELVEQIKAIDNGADLGLDKASLEADLNAIRKGNETGNNTINIFRRNKEGLIEVVKAQALKTDEVLKVADMSAEYVELQNIIEAESAKFKGYDNLMRSNAVEAIQKVEQAKQRQAEIRNSGIMKSAIDRLKQSGITKNEKGELIDDNGLIGMLYGGYQTATGEFTQQQAGLETRGKKAPSNNDAVTRYLKSARRASQLEQDIARRQVLANQSTGSEQRNHQEVIRTAQQQLSVEQSKLALYNRQEGTLNGIKLSEKEIAKLETESVYIQQRKEMALAKIGANMKMEQGLLDKMLNGFKQQFSNFLGMNMTYQLVGKIRQLFSQIVQLTAQLDANMVDIQIASGGTREDIENMMKGFNALAMKTGRSTSEVATAANECDLKAIYSKSSNAFTNLRHALVVKTLV